MTDPTVSATPNLCKFDWPNIFLRTVISRINEHRDGRVTAEITITTNAPAYSPLLHQSQLNLTSSAARDKLARIMEGKYNLRDYDTTWDTLLEEVCYTSLKIHRQGEPLKELWSYQEAAPPEYLIRPLLQVNKPTILFGDGGSGKSTLATLFGILVSLPWTDNPFNLCVQPHCSPTLYLDWEGDSEDLIWRIHLMKRGLDLAEFNIQYRRCSYPFADDFEIIQSLVMDNNIRFLIVDSLGLACGGDLNAAEPATRFFQALRQLSVTSIIVAHPPKDSVTKTQSIYGSGFFRYLARSVWECKRVQEVGENEMAIGLFHRKANYSQLFTPLGFRIQFSDTSITVQAQDIRDMEELGQHLPSSMRIINVLRGGAMTTEEIAEELDITKGTIQVNLSRLRDKGRVVKLDNKTFGLPAYEGYQP